MLERMCGQLLIAGSNKKFLQDCTTYKSKTGLVRLTKKNCTGMMTRTTQDFWTTFQPNRHIGNGTMNVTELASNWKAVVATSD